LKGAAAAGGPWPWGSEGPDRVGGDLAWPERPTSPAHVFKVAHHGGKSGHLEAMWDELLVEKPISILTPFVRGRQSLPTVEDLRRITSRSAKTLITTLPNRSHPKGEVRRSTRYDVSCENRRENQSSGKTGNGCHLLSFTVCG